MDPSQRGRVLIVDDDPTVAEVVAGYLDRAGYAVDRAEDGPAALDLAAEHRPDLVLLDLMLPGMDGLEVCRRLRGNGPTAGPNPGGPSAPNTSSAPSAPSAPNTPSAPSAPSAAPVPGTCRVQDSAQARGRPSGVPREPMDGHPSSAAPAPADGPDGTRRTAPAHAPAPATPVIMLTARGDEDDRILGLEVGADDYVTKPFSPRELVLRVESVLRRSLAPPHSTAAEQGAAEQGVAGRGAAEERTPGSGGPGELAAAGLRLDPAARRVTKDGVELALTLREFDLLAFFLRHPGRAFSREELMRRVWGWDFGDLSTVTVHVRRLRGKTEDDPATPSLIQTVWGVGYRFEAVRPSQPG